MIAKKYPISFRWLFPFLLIAQVLFLCFTMFSAGNTIQDGDVARQYTHMIAMWESGTIFVPDWIYTTTMETDTAVLLALPFYGLLKDAILAFCFANVVNIALWIVFIFFFCKRINQNYSLSINPYLVCVLVLIPYSTGNLYYWNMMFLNCSPYTLKVILPLLLIFLLLLPEPKAPRKRDWILLSGYLFLLGLTSLSSGVYVAAMGIAPVLLVFAMQWLREKVRLSPYYLVCTFGSVIVTLLGRFLGLLTGVNITGGQMVLSSLSTLPDNAANNLVGFFRLFGAVTRDKTSVTRLTGIAQLLCWGIALVMLYQCAAVLFRGIRGKIPENTYPIVYLIAPAVWNFILLSILDTRYGDPYFEVRYHLIGGIPLLFLLSAQFSNSSSCCSNRLNRARHIIGTLALCSLIFLCDRRAYMVYWPPEGTVGINAKEQKLCSEISQLDVTDVFVLQSNTTSEICGLLDRNHSYKLLWLQDEICYLHTFDASMTDVDAHPHMGPAALVLTSTSSLSELPFYLQKNTTYYTETEDYIIYLLDSGSLPDGVVGLPYTGTGLDYPNSVGYTYRGTVDENRTLNTDGYDGIVMQSPDLKFACTTDIFLSYAALTNDPDTMGIVVLSQNGTVLETQSLSASASQVVFHDVAPGDGYQLSVELYAGACASLQNIVFTSTGS